MIFTVHGPALMDLFLLMLFVLQWLSLHWEILIMLLCQFPLTFYQTYNGMPGFIACITFDFSHADWDRLRDHLRDVPLEDIFKIGASTAASEFSEWVQVDIDVYVPHRKYQVKPQLSPCFSAACAAVIIHRNHFFRFYQKEKSSVSKLKFRQASNHCKRVVEAAKLAYVN